jgi:hypothetical protein
MHQRLACALRLFAAELEAAWTPVDEVNGRRRYHFRGPELARQWDWHVGIFDVRWFSVPTLARVVRQRHQCGENDTKQNNACGDETNHYFRAVRFAEREAGRKRAIADIGPNLLGGIIAPIAASPVRFACRALGGGDQLYRTNQRSFLADYGMDRRMGSYNR